MWMSLLVRCGGLCAGGVFARPRRVSPSEGVSPSGSLADVFGPVFEIGLEVGHEFAGVGSVYEAVVEAEGEALDGADGDGVVAVLVGEDFGLFVETADAEDGRLRLVDDRRAEL